MPVLTWGTTGGSTKGSYTGAAGGGWVTHNLSAPNVRQIYDGTKPIRVVGTSINMGSGSRTSYYRMGSSSSWQSSGYHNIADNTTFDFRVAQTSGTIYLGFAPAAGYTTTWLDGDPLSYGAGVQPGDMTWHQAPSAPGTSVTPNNLIAGRVDIGVTAPSDNGGTSVTTYLHQISTNSGFTNVIAEWTSAASSTNRTGLPVGQTLYHRAMAQNAVTNGVSKKGGAASTTRSFQLGTAVATAPGRSVVSSASGASATVTLTPPTDTGGLPITGYEIDYEYLSPAPIPSPALVTVATTSLTTSVAPLVPGASYRWRARAKNQLGFGPNSTWLTVVQLKPSTSPGDYFDGSTAATTDGTFAWNGTAGNSTSIAQASGVLGWSLPDAVGTDAVLARATGGRYGNYAGRVVIKKDATGPGLRVGQANVAGSRAGVLFGQNYSGSISVYLSRPQRMVAEITWADAGGGLVTRSYGEEVLVPANQWVTLQVPSAMAALGASFGMIRVIDVAGDGWSAWRSGEEFLVDAAIFTLGGPYPYFDGSFPDEEQYRYSWEGTANDSLSVRETVAVKVNPLVDPDCVTVPAAPRPPVVPNTCIDEVGIWRRYWYRIEAGDVKEWFDTIPTVTIRTGLEAERQVRLRYYANPFERDISTLDPEDFCAEQIISFLPRDSVLTLDGITESAWASVSGAASLDANHLLYGSDGMPASWPVLECGIGYYITMDVPPENAEGNVSLEFDLVTRF